MYGNYLLLIHLTFLVISFFTLFDQIFANIFGLRGIQELSIV